MTCPILGYPCQATGLGLCQGHWKHVPRPIQSEIYQLVKRHRNGPAHQKAIRRAITAVDGMLKKWDREAASSREQPASAPYRDD